jgi:hypothetical protein
MTLAPPMAARTRWMGTDDNLQQNAACQRRDRVLR